MPIGAWIFVLCIFTLILLVPAKIAHRNVTFQKPYRVIYALGVGPIFIVFMVLNIYLVNRFLPMLFRVLRWKENDTVLAGWVGEEVEALGAFAIAAPLGLLAVYFWHLLFKTIDKKNAL